MPKLLVEFLHEQQEPFSLDLYLIERGYSRGNAVGLVSSVHGLRRRRYAITNCSKFVKAVLGKLLQHHDSLKNRNGSKTDGTLPDGCESREEHAHGKSFSGTYVFNSCPGSDVEDAHYAATGRFSDNGSLFSEEEADAESKLKCKSMGYGDKQLSPVSLLEETESDEGSPVHDKPTKEESSTSTSRCKSKCRQTRYSVQELHELVDSKSQYVINKRALQQTKRLLIDCVREVIENHRKKDKTRQQQKQILGADELWQLVWDNVWIWSQDSVHKTNIVHLLHYDFWASVEEWHGDYEQKKEEFSMEIADDILEGIIEETVMGNKF